MKLLLLGASSYIGARIYFDLKDTFEIVGTYHTNNTVSNNFIQADIRDKQSVETLFSTVQPDVVVHLANYSSPRHIKGNETDFPKLNFEATKNIVALINKFKKKLIFFSSLAATTQQDLYGELKAKSEDVVKTTHSGFVIIRPSAVIGLSPVQSHNKITDKILSVINGQAQEFDASWILQPTYIGHLSQLVDQIISKNMWNTEVNIFTDYPVTQFQIASDILKYFDAQPTPLDTGRSVPLATLNKESLEPFKIVPFTYEEIIIQIVTELKNPKQFQTR